MPADEGKLRAELMRAQTKLNRAQRKRLQVIAEGERELQRARRRAERRTRRATAHVERCAQVVADVEARLREAQTADTGAQR